MTDCKAELIAAEEYHADYVRQIDEALGQPRDLTKGSLVDQHVQAIRLLKIIAKEQQA